MYISFSLYCCFACISVTLNVQLRKSHLVEILIEFSAAAFQINAATERLFPSEKGFTFLN